MIEVKGLTKYYGELAAIHDLAFSIDRGEVTDKGSINQRAVLENRSALIEEIYAPAPPAQVIRL